ncbi:MAG: anaerobic C4-dicarboxylate transporter [Deferribacterales bacterium]|nr:anaerobic C4-dicarboxylate transporter [Deferribacterales bacterium]
MLILQLIVLFGAIFLGVRIGGIAIGYAGGLGVIVLALCLGMTPGNIPWDVILIIMSVIAAITAMQAAGGLDYLVQVAEKILRKNPKHINYLAPTITYLLTVFAGTGHTAFSMIPVIVEVAKGQNIKPSAPLSLAVVSSQIAITASPVSAAVIFLSGVLEPLGVSYPLLLAICIPTTYVGCMIAAFIVNKFYDLDLSKDPVYKQRLEAGLVKQDSKVEYKELPKGAKLSVLIFLLGVIAVVFYATAISNNVKLIDPVIMKRDAAIISFMLGVATLITIFCKVNVDVMPSLSVFKSGMTACVCVLGVAWLGDTFVSGHVEEIKAFASEAVSAYPFLLAVVLAFAAMLLYSQAATTKAIMPAVILALGITPENNGDVYIIVASFAAVSALFVLPTYPTLLGAVQMDDTGSTKIGKYVFNHSFFVTGVMMIIFSVALGFLVAPILI